MSAGQLGARVDILGEEIHLVAKTNSSDQGLSLLAEDLSKLQVGSTLIGGTRDDSKPGDIKVSAQKVTVEENAKVTMPAVVLVAEQEVRVNAGAELTATAAPGATTGPVLNLDKPAALLRLAGEQARVQAPAVTDANKLSLAQGAVIKAMRCWPARRPPSLTAH